MERVYTTNEIRERLFPVFNAIPVERAILFGSYARGTQVLASDVDILIDSKGKIRGIDFFGVLDDVAEALGTKVDLVEASQIIDGGKAQREISETGIVIYERT
jgi:hypothetical protein